jgi:HemY protein
MMRLVLFLLGVLAVAAGLAWLADRPGNVVVTWQDYEIETSVFRAVVIATVLSGAAVLCWSLLRQIWSGPANVGHFLTRRRHRRGLDALSSGMIAIGAGDRTMASRYALQARKALPNEPLTHLLRAQAAQLSGDKGTARRIFEAMLASPDTEQLGLRGLFLEAGREGEQVAQRQFAARALRLNSKLSWPVEALFELECKSSDWPAALKTLAAARKNGLVDRAMADRRRAVLLTAQAQVAEDSDPESALNLALEAQGLAADLIPAAVIAGRILVSRGHTARAAKTIHKTWTKAAHPDLATVYAYARVGDSPRDRLDRVKQLATLNPSSIESSIAVAAAAIEARDFDLARHSLAPFLETGLTRRIATLMARIESEQHADRGRVREWLARAVSARRDAAWTADGVVSDRWAPISPVTGALDAFQWRVPVEEIKSAETGSSEMALEQLGSLGDEGAEAKDIALRRAGEAVDAVTIDQAPARGAGETPAVQPTATASAKIAPGPEKPGNTDVTGTPSTKSKVPNPPLSAKLPPDAALPGKATVFVAPHAPDDPGPETGDSDDAGIETRPFRT